MYLLYVYLAIQFIFNNPSLFYYGARLLRFSLVLIPQVVRVATIPLRSNWNKIDSVEVDPFSKKTTIQENLVEVEEEKSCSNKLNE